MLLSIIRGVAQLVSVPALGAGGRQFESDHPDKRKALRESGTGFFVLDITRLA